MSRDPLSPDQQPRPPAARAAGYAPTGKDETARTEAHRDLAKPHVREALAAALDKAGCTIEATAKVVADAHKATEIRTYHDGEGGIIESREYVDHRTRLRAGELAAKFRGALSDGGAQGGAPSLAVLINIVRREGETRGIGV